MPADFFFAFSIFIFIIFFAPFIPRLTTPPPPFGSAAPAIDDSRARRHRRQFTSLGPRDVLSRTRSPEAPLHRWLFRAS